MDSLKVSVSGVRGVVGRTMTPAIAASFGQAFGCFVGKGKVVVGRDTRPSGSMLEDALIAGLQSVGCRPVQVGVAPTPSILYYTRKIRARGGIAITASHNSAEWNAFKFVDRSGKFLDPVHAEELFDVYHQRSFATVSEKDLKTVEVESQVTKSHFRKVLGYVDGERIQQAGLKVAVDCCNGVGAVFSKEFLQKLGCTVVAIHNEPHGRFERPPEPRPDNLSALCKVVLEQGCDIGFAQDPDGDRLAIVDEKGRPIGEDLSLGLAALQVITSHQKGPVVANLPISQAVKDKLLDLGSVLFLTATGEINVSTEILRKDAVIGGEDSGGVIIPAIHPCRDSFAGMAVILELLAFTGQSVSDLVRQFPTYYMLKDKITVRPDVASSVLRAIRDHYPADRMKRIDGIYVDLDDGWIQVRRSNTEPVIRLIAEARTEKLAKQRMAELRKLVESV